MARVYPKIPHLPGSRTGPSDRHVGLARARSLVSIARRDHRVVVEEKLDGSCVVVLRRGPELLALGRDGRPACLSRNLGRRLFALWVSEQRARFLSLLQAGEQASGEWLALAHGTRYSLPHEPFVLFDLGEGASRLGRGALHRRAAASGFTVPCILHEGGALGTEDAYRLLGLRGRHGAEEAAEGVVYREEHLGTLAPTFVAKHVRSGKSDGCYLADHTGLPHVWNAWPGSEPWLSMARRRCALEESS